ncbi:MAG TPA: hypothetical protein VFN38_06525, partial [Gemmatimonadaceae bacterium]|nr:hypothetical protein [Gemmatimonadaceae bacterium]
IGFPGAPGFLASTLAAIVIIAFWALATSSRSNNGEPVERPERVPQLYGYTVCLVVLLWSITSTITVVESVLTLSAPEYRSGRDYVGIEPSVSSFEAFRTTYERSRRMMGGDPRVATAPDTLTDAELHRRYDALRADRIQRNTVEARRSLIASFLSLLIASVLFAFHWRWLKRTGNAPAFGGTSRIDI